MNSDQYSWESMQSSGEQLAVSRPQGKADYWSQGIATSILFLIFLFIFDGVSPTFSSRNYSELAQQMKVIESARGSFLPQLFWLGLLAGGNILVLLRINDFLRHLPRLVPLILLMLWCVMSTLWSEHEMITFRRSTLLLVIFLSLYIAVAYSRQFSVLIKAAYMAAFVALCMDIASLALFWVLDSADPFVAGNFKGIHGHKNTAGVLAVIAFFLGLLARPYIRGQFGKQLNSFFLAAWIAILIISFSKTSIGLLFVTSILVYFAHLIARMIGLSLGSVLLIMLFSIVFALTMLEAAAGISLGKLLAVAAGEEITFTGRTNLWLYVIKKLKLNWLLGYGYGGFWRVGFNFEYHRFHQAHNGYIDLIVNTGLIGATLFFAALIGFDRRMRGVRLTESRMYFILWMMMTFALLHNMMESSIVRTSHPLWVLVLFVLIVSARVAYESSHSHLVSSARRIPFADRSAMSSME